MKKQIIFKTIMKKAFLYLLIFFSQNLRNIFVYLDRNINNISFITIPIVVSFSILLLYQNYIKKRNSYLNGVFYSFFIFYNLLCGLLYTANIHTFFILYIILNLFSFLIFPKIRNYSYSIIVSFSIVILFTMTLGLFNLLILAKYLLPLSSLLATLYISKNKDKYDKEYDNFFNSEFLVFSILFIIAVTGGLGRFVHTYDEYSHWGYDAKAVIYYDKLSTSSEIMSKTRSYAPIITCWHYLVAQFSEFQEQNLYIGLNIFCMIFIMSIFSGIKKYRLSFIILSIIAAYSCSFYLGNVYNFDTIYADFAMGCVFGATLINYYRDSKDTISMSILLIMLTLIKPNGCVASFSILFLMFIDYIINTKKLKILPLIKSFIKQYWKYIIVVIGSFMLWSFYVKFISYFNVEFYTYDVRPIGLFSNLEYKLNVDFIFNFIKRVIVSFDQDIIYSIFSLSFYKFIIIIFLSLFLIKLSYNRYNYEKTRKEFIPLISSYIVFFAFTIVSIFVMLSVYEASILASVGRYVDTMNVALLFLTVFYIINAKFIINEKRQTVSTILLLMIIFGLSFNQITFFITDLPNRKSTMEIKDKLTDKFSEVNKKTKKTDRIYVIDQNDTDGIMAMWYARYYLFPRKINASSQAISWKIRTEKNKDDLQDWGMTVKDLEKELIEDGFNYIYFYSIDAEFIGKCSFLFDDYNKKYSLYKVEITDNKVKLVPAR